jgi:arginyl-tRNA--protein-N-Asp/Glu arginylyltransferase
VPFLQSTMGKRWASKFPARPHCDSTRSLDGPRITPNPTAVTGKKISYSHDSTNSYISSLNNSSLSDFLIVTIPPFRKVLLLTEAEVVEKIEEVQEVEMEVQEVEEEADSGCLLLG